MEQSKIIKPEIAVKDIRLDTGRDQDTPATGVRTLGELVDEAASLKEEIKSFEKTKVKRYKVLCDVIKELGTQEVSPTKRATIQGRTAVANISPKGITREIVNKEKVLGIVGLNAFVENVKIPLSFIDSELTHSERGEVLTESFSGNRVITFTKIVE